MAPSGILFVHLENTANKKASIQLSIEAFLLHLRPESNQHDR